MIVSTATAVLPVCRSPMMSSRWPRPTGTIESIDFRPVCTGCETFLRQITPGATFSITSVIFASIGPLPSIGWPSELTTRPMSSGPTGTSRMRPVHLTVSPSLMCSYSPSTTDPTESRSRLSARPNVLPGNSSISPCIALERPWMRQMPSVTDTTVPCVRTSAPVSRFWMRALMISLISEGLSCMVVFLWLGAKLRAHRSELRLYRSVDHRVADGDARAADQARVDGDRRLDPAPEAPGERLREVSELGVGERQRRFDQRLGGGLGIVLQRFELRGDLGKHRNAARVDQHVHEVAPLRVKAVAGDRQQQRLAGADVEERIVERRGDLRVGDDLGAEGQHLRPLGEAPFLPREPECGLGVRARDGGELSHGRRVTARFGSLRADRRAPSRRPRASGSSTRPRPQGRRPGS